MKVETIELLQRKLERNSSAYTTVQGKVAADSLALFEVNSNASISKCLKHFRLSAARAMEEYGEQTRDIILTTLRNTGSTLDPEGKHQVEAVLRPFFTSELSCYETRFQSFQGSLVRHMQGYGVAVDLHNYRPDIAQSQYVVHGTNLARRIRELVADDLEELVLRDAARVNADAATPSMLQEANQFLKLEPNFMGIGLNFNYLIRRLLGRDKQGPKHPHHKSLDSGQ